ncbi:MAG: serine/threonine protein kinase [Deltaproteobacteria bacterium HGW-Deltaproteobacteria-15]|nr:MAG: serine/threonine protein kinase [Deltaproteobacteria bacterium HGW-Deltaproteobacteria-15]
MLEKELRDRVEQYSRYPPRQIRLIRDTSQFMEINADDVLELDGKYYLVRGDEFEPRFGLEGDPKFWVKKAIDLSDGSSKIIKLVFHESCYMGIGEFRIRCYRSPEKEARVLDKMRDDPSFMHGTTVMDDAGNAVRIVDRIRGPSLYTFMQSFKMDHETYFREHLPGLLRSLMECMEAIGRLHEAGEVHGDIRTDHVIIERDTQAYRWIDFDFAYEWTENPLGIDILGLGNVLLFVLGKGFYDDYDLRACGKEGLDVLSTLTESDYSLYSRQRIANLKKLFSYFSECFNQVLLRFTPGAEVFYENTEELLDDLSACEPSLSG